MTNTWHRTVVVGVDGSENSLAAVDFAATEADLHGLPLLLLSAYPPYRVAAPDTGPHISLTAFLRRVCTTWPGLTATGRNISGDPVEVLVGASRTAALVVVGRDEPHGGRCPGPVWARVAAHAFSPTVVVPPVAPAAEGSVLLGLAISADDEQATAFAFEEAALRQARLLAVHVWSGMPGDVMTTLSPFAYDLREARAAADRMLAETLAGWPKKYPDLAVDRVPLYDVSPARTLREASALAGLVVVGARRDGHRGSQLLGTVTRTLTEQATCPVAVVSPAPHR